MSGFRCQFCKGSLTKVHYPKLYNMAYLSLNVFTASKGSNNYIRVFYFIYVVILMALWVYIIQKVFSSLYMHNYGYHGITHTKRKDFTKIYLESHSYVSVLFSQLFYRSTASLLV